MPKIFLPDVNVWIGLTFDSHIHHPDAKAWFDSLIDEKVVFCRMTQQGFFRLSTSPSVMKHHALSMIEAWQKYDQFMSDPRVSYASEPMGVDAQWRSLTQSTKSSTHVWNDAYLASFAIASTYEIVTFDQGFKQFPGLSVLVL